MVMSVCFSWALDPYNINFRFCLAIICELYLPDEQRKKLSNSVGYLMTIII